MRLVATLISSTGTIVSKPSEKDEIFKNYFKSVFTVEDLSDIPNKNTSPYPSIPEINITLQGVINLLSIAVTLINHLVLTTYTLHF